jgi:hypothetical protein
MKYKTPELTALPTAIDAIQGTGTQKHDQTASDSPGNYEDSAAYADWE